ncbi:MAG: YbjN domain-containing protein [Oscillospiraceae bacterium]
MISVLQLIKNWCEKNNVSAETAGERVSFSVDGANGSFPAALLALEEDRALVCLYGVQTLVPKELRAEAAQRLSDINLPIKLGAAFLNNENGELSYRVTQLLPENDEEAAALTERALLLSSSTMDRLLQALSRLCSQ